MIRVKASYEKRHFVDESKFGFKQHEQLFMNKPVMYSKRFEEANSKAKQSKLPHCNALIKDYGKGSIVTDKNKAHYILIASDEKPSDYQGKIVLNWEAFIELIFPKKGNSSQ